MINWGTPLDQVETEEYGVMPVGEYLGFIEDAEEQRSGSGNDMLKLTIRLKGNEKYNNKVLYFYLVFGLEFSLENTKKLMMALRQNITGMTGVNAAALKGLPCKVKTKHEEYNGEQTDKIHYFCQFNDEEYDQIMDIDRDAVIPNDMESAEDKLVDEALAVGDDDMPKEWG